MIEIIKRDGRLVPYNKNKIREAMLKAFNEEYLLKPGYNLEKFRYERIIESVLHKIEEVAKIGSITVELILDFVVQSLKETYPIVGARYQSYRNIRSKARDKKNPRYINAIKKLQGSDPENLNANVDDKCFSGRLKGFLEAYYKPTALDMMPEKFAENHQEYLSYIHDLDSYGLAHNCLSLPLDDLLNKHTIIKQTDLRPAKSIGSALQMTAVYMQLQSLDMFGGVSATHIDTTMVPFFRFSFYKHFLEGLKYVENRYEDYSMTDDNIRAKSIDDVYYTMHPQAYRYALDMTTKDTYQGVEALLHNLNSLQSRSGGQLPFTSINYGLETSHEGRIIIKAILDTTLKGLGEHGRTSIFP